MPLYRGVKPLVLGDSYSHRRDTWLPESTEGDHRHDDVEAGHAPAKEKAGELGEYYAREHGHGKQEAEEV